MSHIWDLVRECLWWCFASRFWTWHIWAYCKIFVLVTYFFLNLLSKKYAAAFKYFFDKNLSVFPLGVFTIRYFLIILYFLSLLLLPFAAYMFIPYSIGVLHNQVFWKSVLIWYLKVLESWQLSGICIILTFRNIPITMQGLRISIEKSSLFHNC